MDYRALLGGSQNSLWRGHAAFSELDTADGIYQVNGTLHKESVSVIEAGDCLALIDKQGERKSVPGAESGVAGCAARVYTVHDGVTRLKIRPAVSQVAELLRSTGRVVGRIEHEYNISSAEIFQPDHNTGLIGQGEFRSRGPGRERL